MNNEVELKQSIKDDIQVIHHLWWLNKFLTRHFAGKEYKDIIRKELDVDICKEVDELVEHIKANY